MTASMRSSAQAVLLAALSLTMVCACSEEDDDDDGSNQYFPMSGGTQGTMVPGAGGGMGMGQTPGAVGGGVAQGMGGTSTQPYGGSVGGTTAQPYGSAATTSVSTGATTTGSGATGATSSSSGGGTTSLQLPSTDACPGVPLATGDSGTPDCVGTGSEAESVPVDMFIMQDRSSSMTYDFGSTTRWEMLRTAVQEFVSNPEAADVGIGIQFFSQSGSGDDSVDCDANRYAQPVVEIGLASEVGQDVVAAIDAMEPLGYTPTVPALEGAIRHAKQWDPQHPGRVTVVLLVTDGFPTQCPDDATANDIAAVAADGFNTEPSIRTFVIGIEAGFNLDNIAKQGGTGTAFMIEEGDPASKFLDTMLNITLRGMACEYELPDPPSTLEKIDTNMVQVLYRPASTGEWEEIPKGNSYADCANSPNGGWYYNRTIDPTKILVCPCTCQRFQAGTVQIAVGCEPVPVDIF